MITLADVVAAKEAIAGTLVETPLMPWLSPESNIPGQLWLKAELFQRTGSFKPRGVLNWLRHLDTDARRRGIITISAGNHAQAVAWAAREAGVQCTVVMPAKANPAKVAATRGYGAEVIQHGAGAEMFAKLSELQAARDLQLIHPFDDPWVIAGQGTVGLEIIDSLPSVDVIVCPIGGGGLIAGVALAVSARKPGVRILGVEPVGAAAMRRSWDEGKPMMLDVTNTIADGLAAPLVGHLPYALTRKYVEDIVTITDEEIMAGMRALVTTAKMCAEPAGAAAMGALLAGKVPLRPGDVVAAVVSGGNFDPRILRAILDA